jgi:glycosyltransferase involved in cell wall biosynthesis
MKMLSIIIPTYNEEKYLPLLLDSIKSQDYHDYEIIVSDDSSKDATRNIAKQYRCRVLNGKGGSPARARNRGARQAKGEILLFLDSDVIMPKDFLKENLGEFIQKGLVSASVWAKPLSKRWDDRFLLWIQMFTQNLLKRIIPLGAGWCIFVTRKAFNEIGGFDEDLLVAEDFDFLTRTKKYKKFDMLKKKNIYASVRRYDKEGRFRYMTKIIGTSIMYLFGKRMTLSKKEVEYKFGGYGHIKKREIPEIK